MSNTKTKAGITFAQVADAAASLKSRGLEPTGYAIRAELGNTGSFTTIQAHLAKWKAESAESVRVKELPPEVENAMQTAIATCWAMANKVAEESVAIVRQQLHEKDQELKQAEALIQELEKRTEEAEAAATKAQQEASDKAGKLQVLKGAHDELKARFDDLVGLKRQAEGKVAVLDTKKAPARKKAADTESTPAAQPAAQ